MLDKFSKLVKHHAHPDSPRSTNDENHPDKPQTSPPRRNHNKTSLIRVESEKPNSKKERKKLFSFKKNKSERMGTAPSDDSTAGSSFTTMTTPVLHRKKYVKATPPPPVETAETKEETEDDVSLPESKGVFGTPEMTQNEKTREILEKQRKDSLKTYLERQKEQRTELTEQKRRKSTDREKAPPSPSPPPASSSASSGASKIFSVQPQFPEHKRSIDEPVVEEDETILPKKIRKKDEEEEPEIQQEKEVEKESLQPSGDVQKKEDVVEDVDRTTTEKSEFDEYIPSSLTGWLKVIVPVLAITTIVAVKVYQRKK